MSAFQLMAEEYRDRKRSKLTTSRIRVNPDTLDLWEGLDGQSGVTIVDGVIRFDGIPMVADESLEPDLYEFDP